MDGRHELSSLERARLLAGALPHGQQHPAMLNPAFVDSPGGLAGALSRQSAADYGRCTPSAGINSLSQYQGRFLPPSVPLHTPNGNYSLLSQYMESSSPGPSVSDAFKSMMPGLPQYWAAAQPPAASHGEGYPRYGLGTGMYSPYLSLLSASEHSVSLYTSHSAPPAASQSQPTYHRIYELHKEALYDAHGHVSTPSPALHSSVRPLGAPAGLGFGTGGYLGNSNGHSVSAALHSLHGMAGKAGVAVPPSQKQELTQDRHSRMSEGHNKRQSDPKTFKQDHESHKVIHKSHISGSDNKDKCKHADINGNSSRKNSSKKSDGAKDISPSRSSASTVEKDSGLSSKEHASGKDKSENIVKKGVSKAALGEKSIVTSSNNMTATVSPSDSKVMPVTVAQTSKPSSTNMLNKRSSSSSINAERTLISDSKVSRSVTSSQSHGHNIIKAASPSHTDNLGKLVSSHTVTTTSQGHAGVPTSLSDSLSKPVSTNQTSGNMGKSSLTGQVDGPVLQVNSDKTAKPAATTVPSTTERPVLVAPPNGNSDRYVVGHSGRLDKSVPSDQVSMSEQSQAVGQNGHSDKPVAEHSVNAERTVIGNTTNASCLVAASQSGNSAPVVACRSSHTPVGGHVPKVERLLKAAQIVSVERPSDSPQNGNADRLVAKVNKPVIGPAVCGNKPPGGGNSPGSKPGTRSHNGSPDQPASASHPHNASVSPKTRKRSPQNSPTTSAKKQDVKGRSPQKESPACSPPAPPRISEGKTQSIPTVSPLTVSDSNSLPTVVTSTSPGGGVYSMYPSTKPHTAVYMSAGAVDPIKTTDGKPLVPMTNSSTHLLPFYQSLYSKSQQTGGQEGRKVHAPTYTPEVGTLPGVTCTTPSVNTSTAKSTYSEHKTKTDSIKSCSDGHKLSGEPAKVLTPCDKHEKQTSLRHDVSRTKVEKTKKATGINIVESVEDNTKSVDKNVINEGVSAIGEVKKEPTCMPVINSNTVKQEPLPRTSRSVGVDRPAATSIDIGKKHPSIVSVPLSMPYRDIIHEYGQPRSNVNLVDMHLSPLGEGQSGPPGPMSGGVEGASPSSSMMVESQSAHMTSTTTHPVTALASQRGLLLPYGSHLLPSTSPEEDQRKLMEAQQLQHQLIVGCEAATNTVVARASASDAPLLRPMASESQDTKLPVQTSHVGPSVTSEMTLSQGIVIGTDNKTMQVSREVAQAYAIAASSGASIVTSDGCMVKVDSQTQADVKPLILPQSLQPSASLLMPQVKGTMPHPELQPQAQGVTGGELSQPVEAPNSNIVTTQTTTSDEAPSASGLNIPVGIAVARQRQETSTTNRRDVGDLESSSDEEPCDNRRQDDILQRQHSQEHREREEFLREQKDILASQPKVSVPGPHEMHTELGSNLVITGGSTTGTAMGWRDGAPARAPMTTPWIQSGHPISPALWLGQGPYTLPHAIHPSSVEAPTHIPINPPGGFKLAQDPITGQLYLIPEVPLEHSRLWTAYAAATPPMQPSHQLQLMAQQHSQQLQQQTLQAQQHQQQDRNFSMDYVMTVHYQQQMQQQQQQLQQQQQQAQELMMENAAREKEKILLDDQTKVQGALRSAQTTPHPASTPEGKGGSPHAVPVSQAQAIQPADKDKGTIHPQHTPFIPAGIPIAAAGQAYAYYPPHLPYFYDPNLMHQLTSGLSMGDTGPRQDPGLQSRGTSPMTIMTTGSVLNATDAVSSSVKSPQPIIGSATEESEEMVVEKPQQSTVCVQTSPDAEALQNSIQPALMEASHKEQSIQTSGEFSDTSIQEPEMPVLKSEVNVEPPCPSVIDCQSDSSVPGGPAPLSPCKTVNSSTQSDNECSQDVCDTTETLCAKSEAPTLEKVEPPSPETLPTLEAEEPSVEEQKEETETEMENSEETVTKTEVELEEPSSNCSDPNPEACEFEATSGLELLSMLCEQKEAEWKTEQQARRSSEVKTEPGVDSCKVAAGSAPDINRNYSTHTKSDLNALREAASIPSRNFTINKASIGQYTAGGYRIPPGRATCAEGMDAAELEMRMKLAELQRKYKEKQRELARLQPKKDKDDEKQLIKRGPGRPRKRKFSKKCSKSEMFSMTRPNLSHLTLSAPLIEEPALKKKKHATKSETKPLIQPVIKHQPPRTKGLPVEKPSPSKSPVQASSKVKAKATVSKKKKNATSNISDANKSPATPTSTPKSKSKAKSGSKSPARKEEPACKSKSSKKTDNKESGSTKKSKQKASTAAQLLEQHVSSELQSVRWLFGEADSPASSKSSKKSSKRKQQQQQAEQPAQQQQQQLSSHDMWADSSLHTSPSHVTPYYGLGLLAKYATSSLGEASVATVTSVALKSKEGKKRKKKPEGSDIDIPPVEEAPAVKKRKPGRPKKYNRPTVGGGTETIVSKKPRNLSLLQMKRVSSKMSCTKLSSSKLTTAKLTGSKPPCTKLTPPKLTPPKLTPPKLSPPKLTPAKLQAPKLTTTTTPKVTKKPKNKPKDAEPKQESEPKFPFLEEEWNRRRSERIFLSEPSPITPGKDMPFFASGVASPTLAQAAAAATPKTAVTTTPKTTPTAKSSPSVKAAAVTKTVPSTKTAPSAKAAAPSSKVATSTKAVSSAKAAPSSKTASSAKAVPSTKGTSTKAASAKTVATSATPIKKSASKDKPVKLQTAAPKLQSVQNISQKVKKKYSKSTANRPVNKPLVPATFHLKERIKYDQVYSDSDSDSDSSSTSSEGDNVPLSRFVERPITPEPRSCVINKEELKDGLRVLLFMDSLFYEGAVQAIQPPDIYGVVIDGERGNRPHIFSREEILNEAIIDVKPGSVRYLPEGTRVCAYWSQQFSCLYPGTISKASPNPSTDHRFTNVEFDDGDSGRIPIDHIRMLPQDFPIINVDPNPIMMLGKRRRRTASEDLLCDIKERKPSISDTLSSFQTLASEKSRKRGPGRPSKKKGEETEEKDKTDMIPIEENQEDDVFTHSAIKPVKNDKQAHNIKPEDTKTEKSEVSGSSSKKKHKKKDKEDKSGRKSSGGSSKDEHSKSKHHHHHHHRHHHHHKKHKDKDRERSHEKKHKKSSHKSSKSSLSGETEVSKNISKIVEKAEVITPPITCTETSEKRPDLTFTIKTSTSEIDVPAVDNSDTVSTVSNDVSNSASTTLSQASEIDGASEDSSVTSEEEEIEESIPEKKISVKKTKSSGKQPAKRKRSGRLPSVENRSKIAAFLPARQLWRWSGKSTKRPGMKGKAKKEFYKAITRGKEILRVSDCAVFLSTGRPNLPYVGRIESMWEAWGGNMVVKVKWFYHPEETKGGKRLLEPQGALFQSPHNDENDVQTISHKCEVLGHAEYKAQKTDMAARGIDGDTNDMYYLAGTYDPTIGLVTYEPNVI